ncbi:MAG: glycosyltransferase [Pseudomonadota bacterium]
MNILFLTSTLPRRAGDQQAAFVLDQARAWHAKRPGDRLYVLAPHDAGVAQRETLDGIEVRRFRYMPREHLQTLAYPAILPNIRKKPLRALQVLPFLWAQYAAARAIARDAEIDLVYAHWVMPQGLVAFALRRFAGVPYVLQNHSSDLAVFAKFGRPGRALARLILRRCSAFFCVNSDQGAYAQSLMPGLSPTVLPMGVSLDLPRSSRSQSPQSARYAVGTISRLSKKKGIHHLIDAAERLAAEGRHFTLGIAGDGEDARELMAQPRASDSRFLGFLSGAEKADFFGDCYAMAFPSIDADGDVEGMPVSLLEALVSGKLVLASSATNIRLLPEWPHIRGDVELLEDPADTTAFSAALSRLLDLRECDAHARGARLRDAMQHYAWDRVIERYLGVIDRVTARR